MAVRRATQTFPQSSARWQWVGLLLFTLLAFGLRVYRLDQRSLWTDEGLSVYRARLQPAEILSGEIVIQGVVTKDTQPPLYFLLLHLQQRWGGEGDFSLKFLSAAWGVLVVPLFYALGRRLLSSGAGLVTALLGATSPFYLWYSQEVRMYPMLVALGALSVYALLRALGVPRGGGGYGWWFAYLLSTAAALYTHYSAFFLLGFEVVVTLSLAVWQRRRGALILTALVAAVGLPLVPYALWRLRFVYEYDYHFVPLPTIVTSLFGAFATGLTSQLAYLNWLHMALLVLFLIGLALPAAAGRKGRWGRRAFLLSWLALPTLALFGISLFKPIFQGPRHLMVVSPAFYLALASGVMALWRQWWPAGVLSLSCTLAIILPSWDPFYQVESFPKDDWRGLAAYVTRHAQPGDVLLANDAVLLNVLGYYLPEGFPLTALPLYGHDASEATEAALQELAGQYRRIWFVPQRPADGRDDEGLVARWLDTHLTPTEQVIFQAMNTRVRVHGYLTQSPEIVTLPVTAERLDVAWGDDFVLRGHEIPGEVTPGQLWRLAFYWSRLRPEADQYVLSLRLIDADGTMWAQSHRDLWQLFPPAAWPTEAIVRHEFEMEWPAGLPPGGYQLWLRVVNTRDDQPLPVSTGGFDVLLVPDLEVRLKPGAQDAARLPLHTARYARLGREIELLGYHIREGHHRPGHLLYLDLYWRVRRTPAADYLLRLQLTDESGQVVGETITSPTRAEYLPTRWRPGELLHGQAELLIPPQAGGGFHAVSISLIHPDTGEPLPVRTGWWPFGRGALTLEEVQVVEWPLVAEIPPVQTPYRADFGDPVLIELHGYDLSAARGEPGASFTLTLFWRARARMEASYTVFVHLANAAEQMAGQGDGVPDRGFRLTTSWREGEVISDPHVIPIRADALPGEYRLWVGFYDPATSQRLPAFVEGGRQPADRVLLGIVQVAR